MGDRTLSWLSRKAITYAATTDAWQRNRATQYRIGDLEVDIGKAEVTSESEKIALPKLSFDLLCALINAAPAIVTNDALNLPE
jgi:DNA-binding response OmpR family regulator